MTSIKLPSGKVKRKEQAMNSNILYLRTSTLNLSEGDSCRRKRRATSRIVQCSRGISLSTDFEGPSVTSEWSYTQMYQSKDFGEQNKALAKQVARYSAASAPINRGIQIEEKQSTIDCEYFTLQPLYPNLPSCPDLSVQMQSSTRSSLLHIETSPKQLKSISLPKPPESVQTYSSNSFNYEYSDELLCTEEDEDTLPPYYHIVPQMFYTFAGISHYSNSNQLQSKNDFKQLMNCLGMEEFLDSFLIWFPKPKLVKTNFGYITLNMFCDVFSCKFAQTILEARWQYETLCTAIMTMKCLDKKKLNRIEFHQFSKLYRALHERDISVEKVTNAFNRYDLDGVGLLTVANIFKFCCEEDVDLD